MKYKDSQQLNNYMKGLFLLVILTLVFAKEEYMEYLKAYLKEIGEQEDQKNFRKCIRGGEVLLKNIEMAMDYIRTMEDNEVKTGINIYLSSTKTMLIILKPCMKKHDVLQKLSKYVNQANEDEIFNKISGNIGAYFHLATSAYDSFVKRRYDLAGKNVGEMTYELFLENLEDY